MKLSDYLTLWRLGRRRLRSEKDYRELQSFQATLLAQHLRRFGIELEGNQVLDLGSGIGGYTVEMVKLGAQVISLDLVGSAYGVGQGQASIVADALAIPLPNESVDLVFCASLIEHVSDPALLLSEICRVLNNGGHCYLSFPPFYSPLGGHEYSPWHYFGERWAFRLTRRHHRLPEWAGDIYEISNSPESFAETYQNWGLFKMTIGQAKRLIAATELELINQSTRYLPMSMIRWPILGELLTWHAQFLLKKRTKGTSPGAALERESARLTLNGQRE
jgi:ubiquinone/menaquinone biosynthesis C-methylase UbiE